MQARCPILDLQSAMCESNDVNTETSFQANIWICGQEGSQQNREPVPHPGRAGTWAACNSYLQLCDQSYDDQREPTQPGVASQVMSGRFTPTDTVH